MIIFQLLCSRLFTKCFVCIALLIVTAALGDEFLLRHNNAVMMLYLY